MRAIVFVPGILGSRIDLNGKELWPPDFLEWITHYKRIDQMRNVNARSTAVLARTYGIRVYEPIMDELDKIGRLLTGTRVNFHYDWRDDLAATADLLSVEIANAVRAGVTSVTLVCHSMGGLVARTLLESGRYAAQPWFKTIDLLIAMCTPHLGAPVSFGRALALEPEEYSVRPQDQKVLADDPNFPAVYQCFPVQSRGVLFDESLNPPAKLDIYSAAVGTRYRLNHSNQSAAAASWSRLNISNRPSFVHYVFLSGFGHMTSDQYYFSGTTYRGTVTTSLGDGTVPIWSSNPGYVEQYSFPGSHLDVLKTASFRKKLRELFGLPFMSRDPSELSMLSLSLAKRSFKPEEVMEILLISELEGSRIVGRLKVSVARPAEGSLSDLSSVLLPTGIEAAINFEGGAASYIPMKLMAPSTEGLYVLSFEPDRLGAEAPSVAFFVSQKGKSTESVQRENQRSAAPRRAQPKLPARRKKRSSKR